MDVKWSQRQKEVKNRKGRRQMSGEGSEKQGKEETGEWRRK